MRKFNLKRILIGTLRRRWLFSPMRRDALARAKGKTRYKCTKCKRAKAKSDVTVDHIYPVMGKDLNLIKMNCNTGHTQEVFDWTNYIGRLFCDIDSLQVLCKICHQRKTNAERKRRAKKTS